IRLKNLVPHSPTPHPLRSTHIHAKRHLAEYDQGAMRGEFGGRKSNGTKRKRGRDVETQAEVNLKITERLKDQSIEPFSLASTIAPKFAVTR
ncbi:MAG: hypothetical protein MJ109_05775, partial [Kiritimatiellae bacterium]|nr:hypothetical protein [Kiritimatiellia bacterium]